MDPDRFLREAADAARASSEQLVASVLAGLSAEERAELYRLVDIDLAATPWRPFTGPQAAAIASPATIVGYGGAGGGGKTDCGIGAGVTEHERTILFRQVGTELVAVRDRLRQVLPGAHYNGRDDRFVFRRGGRECVFELGSFPDPGDEAKYRGRPHDLIVFDEASQMRRAAVLFLMGWLRSTTPGQRTRVIMGFNPPTDTEGEWVIEFFAPWLDDRHPNPAKPGEIRWMTTTPEGKTLELPDDRPFVFAPDGTASYDIPPGTPLDRIIRPQSRTFFPARVIDNPFLAGTPYLQGLMALPEPLRSQLLYGDFKAGRVADAFQVIPTAWIDAAMARWKPLDVLPPQDSLGNDAARGGKDEHVTIARHGRWFSRPHAVPGTQVPTGQEGAAAIITQWRDGAPVHVDVLGAGADVHGVLSAFGVQSVPIYFGETTTETTEHGRIGFANVRALLWWRMREALNPSSNRGLALPPDPRLRADLAAVKWKLRGNKIQVIPRDEIVTALGRSPDYGTAAILALIDTPKRAVAEAASRLQNQARGHNPLAAVERDDYRHDDRGHDPFATPARPW